MAGRKKVTKAANKPAAEDTKIAKTPETEVAEAPGLPGRDKMIRVRVVNPSVRVDGMTVVFEDGNPMNARLIPVVFVKPPFNEAFEIPVEVFDTAEKPFDFGEVLLQSLPTRSDINRAFWAANVVRKEDANNFTRVRNALVRAFPDVRGVVNIIRAR